MSIKEQIKQNPYADPLVDFVFKRIFGNNLYKDATIGLLNNFIEDHTITNLEFLNVELTEETEDGRKALVDILCKDDSGAEFIVELQRLKQEHFMKRTIFYASKIISNMEGIKGDWDYNLPPTYVISVIDFELYDKVEHDPILHFVTHDAKTGEKLPGSTEYYFLQLHGFNKSLEDITNNQEKWLYLLKNSKEMKSVPDAYKEGKPFKSYFEASNRAGFTAEENLKYTRAMITQNDIHNAMREAKESGIQQGIAQGREEGIQETKIATAKNFLKEGVSVDVIVRCTGLSAEEIEALK